MKSLKVYQAWQEADPELRIVHGGHRHKISAKSPTSSTSSTSSTLTTEDWEMAKGVPCTRCGKETFRVMGGVCMNCYQGRSAESVVKQDQKRMKRAALRRLYSGRTTLADLKAGRW